MSLFKAVSFGLIVSVSAVDNPAITAAPQLYRRQDDPAFVGLVGDQFSDARRCDFPQTVSTSGSYVQCCPTTGACPFYTTCSSNTLVASNTTVPCDVDPDLACNTGLVMTADNDINTGSYLACWQTSLGTSPFTILRNIDASATSGQGTASGSASSSATGNSGVAEGTSSSGTETSSAASSTETESSSGTSDASASSASETPSSSAAAANAGRLGNRSGGFVGVAMFIVQMLL